MEDIVKEARDGLQNSYDNDRDNRREAQEDLRFCAGFQWSEQAINDRKGLPRITINRASQFLRNVSNPIRQNMPTIKVEPDSDADMNMSEIANGLFRRIQYNSSASHVYAQAVEHMVACGIGWFRVLTDYTDQKSFDQEILIKRVFNPLSVYPDPAAVEPDRSDMSYCVVSEMMPKTAFQARWPKAAVSGLDTPAQGATPLYWGQGDHIRVGEFWKRTETTKKLVRLKDGSTQDLSSYTKRGLDYLREQGLVVAERSAKAYKVQMTMVSGAEQLDETYECPCEWIPLIAVIGAEIPLENGVYRHGLIRFQREPQQLHNLFMSLAAETMAQQPRSPYAVTANMIKRFKNIWDNANRQPTPYLPFDVDESAPGLTPQRLAAAPLPAGLIQMAQMLSDDMKATTGIYDAALGAKSNETSGVAIQGRIEQGNQATFHYSDNLEHSLEHAGRVILGMVPNVYDTQRTLRLMSADDTETEVEINKPVMAYQDDDGPPRQTIINNMAELDFKAVRVIMGPTFAARRQETVQNLVNLSQTLPQIGQVGADIIVKNMDFDGAEQLAERLKSVLPPQILQIENPEQFAAINQPQQPDPMMQMQMQGQAQMMDSQVQAGHAKAEQESAKAEEAHHRAHGAALDNALKVKKLREPPPQPRHGPAGRSNPPNGGFFNG